MFPFDDVIMGKEHTYSHNNDQYLNPRICETATLDV